MVVTRINISETMSRMLFSCTKSIFVSRHLHRNAFWLTLFDVESHNLFMFISIWLAR